LRSGIFDIFPDRPERGHAAAPGDTGIGEQPWPVADRSNVFSFRRETPDGLDGVGLGWFQGTEAWAGC
jgi:hypothetical protein